MPTFDPTLPAGSSANCVGIRNNEIALYDMIIAGGSGVEIDNGNGGAAKTIDWTTSTFQFLTLNSASCALTFTDRTDAVKMVFRVAQDGTGSRTIASYPANVKFPANVEPVLSATASAIDILEFYFNGTDYFLTNAVFAES